MKRWCLGGLLLMLLSATVQAGEPLVTLRLWNEKAPGEKGDIGKEALLPPRGAKPVQRLSNVTDPTISLYKPAAGKETGAAVLVCPGGGVQHPGHGLRGNGSCRLVKFDRCYCYPTEVPGTAPQEPGKTIRHRCRMHSEP
jgi:hypothetical protein